MTGTTVTLQSFLQSLGNVRKSWPTRGWSWDNRLNCLASTFRSDMSPVARAAVANSLPSEFNEGTLRQAPAPVRELATRHGGVRAGQSLFLSPLSGGIYAFGLWWPWEEGSTISMRIGVDGAGDLTFRLCEAMGVEP